MKLSQILLSSIVSIMGLGLYGLLATIAIIEWREGDYFEATLATLFFLIALAAGVAGFLAVNGL